MFNLIPLENADMLFPSIALNSGLPVYVGILFIVGIIALRVLLKLLELGKIYIFGIYCICLGLFSIFL